VTGISIDIWKEFGLDLSLAEAVMTVGSLTITGATLLNMMTITQGTPTHPQIITGDDWQ